MTTGRINQVTTVQCHSSAATLPEERHRHHSDTTTHPDELNGVDHSKLAKCGLPVGLRVKTDRRDRAAPPKSIGAPAAFPCGSFVTVLDTTSRNSTQGHPAANTQTQLRAARGQHKQAPRGFHYDRVFGAGGKRSTTSTSKRESSNASLACKSVVDIVRHRPSIQTPLRARHRMRCAIFRGGGRVQTPPSRNSTDATNQAISSPKATSLLAILQDCA